MVKEPSICLVVKLVALTYIGMIQSHRDTEPSTHPLAHADPNTWIHAYRVWETIVRTLPGLSRLI